VKARNEVLPIYLTTKIIYNDAHIFLNEGNMLPKYLIFIILILLMPLVQANVVSEWIGHQSLELRKSGSFSKGNLDFGSKSKKETNNDKTVDNKSNPQKPSMFSKILGFLGIAALIGLLTVMFGSFTGALLFILGIILILVIVGFIIAKRRQSKQKEDDEEPSLRS